MSHDLARNIVSRRGLAMGMVMLLLLLSTVPSLAQTGPETMNFQGRLLDGDGNPLTAPHCMRFRLCGDADCAESPWPLPAAEFEYHLVTPENGTYKAGLFTVALGSLYGIEPTLLYDRDTLFLEMGVAAAADPCSSLPPGEWETMLPRSQLQASAYAQRSRRVRTTESDNAPLVEVVNTGSGGAIYGQTSGGTGVRGIGGGPSGQVPAVQVGVWGDTSAGIGVLGYTSSATADMAGVAGWATAASGQTYGVWGSTSSDSGYGVYGKGTQVGVRGVGGVESGASAGGAIGLWGDSQDGTGVYGSSTNGYGVHGTAPGTGAAGIATGSSGTTYGLYGRNASSSGAGVYGTSDHASGLGVHGSSTGADGVRGTSIDGNGVHGASTNGYGVYGHSTNSYGVYSQGDAHVEGDLTWQTKTGYVSVSAAAFNPVHDGQGVQLGTYFRAMDGAALGSQGVAQVQLPHGATITKLSFFWEDDSATDTGTLYLRRLALNGNDAPMASVATNDDNLGAPSSSYTTSVWEPVIDNSGYAYYLAVSMSDDSDVTENIYVYGAIIEYTFSEPY